MKQLLPFVTGLLTIVAMWLAGSKRWEAWLVGLLNQILWLATIIVFGTWGLLPLTIFLTFTYARNLYLWRSENSVKAYLKEELNNRVLDEVEQQILYGDTGRIVTKRFTDKDLVESPYLDRDPTEAELVSWGFDITRPITVMKDPVQRYVELWQRPDDAVQP